MIDKDDYKQACIEVREAAVSKDPKGVLGALLKRRLIDGLVNRLKAHCHKRKWLPLPDDDMDYIVVQAISELYDGMQDDKGPKDVVAYLFKTCFYKVCDAYKRRPHTTDLHGGDEDESDPFDALPGPEYEAGVAAAVVAADGQLVALRFVRAMIPQLGEDNIQKVMTFIFDAVERGIMDMPSGEIAGALGMNESSVRKWRSRGFDRLEKRLVASGLLKEGELDLSDFGRANEEEGEAETEGVTASDIES